MRLLSTLLCTFFLLSAVALGAPAGAKRKGRSFEVPRLRRRNYIPHGPAALRKAYRKFSITPTKLGIDLLDFEPLIDNSGSQPAVNIDDAAGGNGEVTAQSVNGDAEFVSPVSVGGQTLLMDFDTGSSDLWVFNTQLSQSAQQGHTVFDPAKSQTFRPLQGFTFNITYGDGSFASGNVGTDNVNIGGAFVDNQAVELPTVVSDSFIQDTSSNGLVGFAFSQLNTVQPQQQNTFFTNLGEQLKDPVMTASLKAGGVGTYEFGKIDPTKFTGELTNVPVDSSSGFWQFDSAMFAVGNGEPQQVQLAPTAIADTGTSLMLVSDDIAEAYYSQVEGAQFVNQAGGFVFPCQSPLPTLSVALGNANMATIPTNVAVFAEIGTNTTTGQTLCFGGIQPNQGNPFQIFGDVFLKSYFVVFDQKGPSLSFASPA